MAVGLGLNNIHATPNEIRLLCSQPASLLDGHSRLCRILPAFMTDQVCRKAQGRLPLIVRSKIGKPSGWTCLFHRCANEWKLYVGQEIYDKVCPRHPRHLSFEDRNHDPSAW